MLSFLQSSTKVVSNGITKLGKHRVLSYKSCRDESDNPSSKSKTKVKDEAESMPQIEFEMEEYKVKVLMTKEEADRLFSKYKNGGIIQVEEVACELVEIHTNHFNVISSTTSIRSRTEPQKYE